MVIWRITREIHKRREFQAQTKYGGFGAVEIKRK
jgi:hypothetical protein